MAWKHAGIWILALLITVASAVFQRKTGPTYPTDGKVKFHNNILSFTFLRTHSGNKGQPVTVEWAHPDTSLEATLLYRRINSSDPWMDIVMGQDESGFYATIPHQPPAGKVEYQIRVTADSSSIFLPGEKPIVTRFKGKVPAAFLIPHILFMFMAMLVSTATGLEALRSPDHLRSYALWTLILMFIGGMVMGPIIQKYAFGDFWTGFPVGTDLTDNKTLIAFLAWCLALIALYKRPPARGWVIAASVITFLIFLIPHSLLGSEIDYEEKNTAPPDSAYQSSKVILDIHAPQSHFERSDSGVGG